MKTLGILGKDGSTFDNETEVLALLSSDTVTSIAHDVGGVFSHVHVDADVEVAGTIVATKTLVFEVSECDTEDGSYTTAYSKTVTGATGGTAVAKYGKLFSFTPDNLSKKYMKLKVTSNFDATGISLKIYSGRFE